VVIFGGIYEINNCYYLFSTKGEFTLYMHW